MSHSEPHTDSNTTNQLLNNLGDAIEEAKLVFKITELKNQTYSIKSSIDKTEHLSNLQNEISDMENKLDLLRKKKN